MAENYCFVEDGVVKEGPMPPPKNWRDTSGFNLLDEAGLKKRGWLPFREIKVPYDSATHGLGERSVEISADEVVYRQTIVAYTPEQVKQNRWNDWSTKMSYSDEKLSRFNEDHITNHHEGVTGDSYSQKIYDDKIADRNSRPEKPS